MTRSVSSGPLEGIVVANLSRVLAGPYCTLLLADLGARVIKIETPLGGDDARGMGPFVDGQSMYFLAANRGKESIALDLKSEDGKRHFEAILAGADVLVENFRPGTLGPIGLRQVGEAVAICRGLASPDLCDPIRDSGALEWSKRL